MLVWHVGWIKEVLLLSKLGTLAPLHIYLVSYVSVPSAICVGLAKGRERRGAGRLDAACISVLSRWYTAKWDGGWEAGCDSRDNEQRMETAERVRGNARKGWRCDANRSKIEEKQSALSGKDSNHWLERFTSSPPTGGGEIPAHRQQSSCPFPSLSLHPPALMARHPLP